jgi:hypothetical protein
LGSRGFPELVQKLRIPPTPLKRLERLDSTHLPQSLEVYPHLLQNKGVYAHLLQSFLLSCPESVLLLLLPLLTLIMMLMLMQRLMLLMFLFFQNVCVLEKENMLRFV